MPLSEYEQRVLEQMERQLSSDDPRLVQTLRTGSRSVRRWLLTGAGAAAGLAVLVIGAATSSPWIGVAGFVLMFASVVLMFSSPRRQQGPVGTVQPGGAVRPRRSRSASFMARMEQRWDRRRENPGP